MARLSTRIVSLLLFQLVCAGTHTPTPTHTHTHTHTHAHAHTHTHTHTHTYTRTHTHTHPHTHTPTHSPLPEYTCIADTDCVLLALTPDGYKRLTAEHPPVALEIQRVILTRSAILRNKLQRELYTTSTVQRESLRLARQAQMRCYRTQLR